MVLRRDGDGVIAIGQTAHAWVSGQLARAWGNERFGEVAPREDVCLGAEQHDVGMADWDLAPTLNAETGWPHSFLEMPLETHLELWSAAPARVLSQSRYASLIVSLHGAGLYALRDLEREPPDAAGAVRAYLRAQRAYQDTLLDSLRGDPLYAEHATGAAVERNRRLVAAWDWISLALCMDVLPSPVGEVPEAAGETTLDLSPVAGRERTASVDPWPFGAPAVTVRCEGRRLPRPFEHESEMRAALAAAPWETLTFELVRDPTPAA